MSILSFKTTKGKRHATEKNTLYGIAFLGALAQVAGDAQASVTTTNADWITFSKGTGVLSLRQASSPVWPTAMSPTTNMDGAVIGAATVVANSAPAFQLYGVDLWASALFNSGLSSYKAASLTATWNATTTLALTEQTRDGASAAGSAGSMILTITKTGSPSDLTQARLLTFLRNLTTVTSSWSTLTGNGVTLAATTGNTLPTGWAIAGIVKDDTPTAMAAVLNPVETTFAWAITDNAGNSTSYQAAMTNLIAANTNVTSTVLSTVFTAPSKSITFAIAPTNLTSMSTLGAQTAILNALNGLTGRIMAAPTSGPNSGAITLYPANPAEVLTILNNRLETTTTDATYHTFAANALARVQDAAFVVGSFSTTADTNKYGLVSIDGAISSASWSVDDSIIKLTGTIGTGVPEVFSFDMSTLGAATFNSATNQVIQLTSPTTGHVVLMKCFDATGLDSSPDNT